MARVVIASLAWVGAWAAAAEALTEAPDGGHADAGWAAEVVYQGRAPLRSAFASADGEGGPAVAYAFEEGGGAWVGIWPDLPPLQVATRARVGCLRLTHDRLWVGLILRDAALPTATFRVEVLGRDGTTHEGWTPSAPTLWVDVGSRCALAVTAWGEPRALVRGRARQGHTVGTLDLWWVSPDTAGAALGWGPSPPQVVNDRVDGGGLSLHLRSRSAPSAPTEAPTWASTWLHMQPDGALTSTHPLPSHLTTWPEITTLMPEDRLLHQRPDAALILRAASNRLERVSMLPFRSR
jgi:hypothetical protein